MRSTEDVVAGSRLHRCLISEELPEVDMLTHNWHDDRTGADDARAEAARVVGGRCQLGEG